MAETERDSTLALCISSEIAAVHKRLLGRGPSGSRTMVRDDLVVCLLSGALTRIEETLRQGGQHELIQRRRTGLHGTLRGDLIATVQRLTGRRVLSLMSAVDPEAELKVDVFVLEPQAGEAPGDGDHPPYRQLV